MLITGRIGTEEFKKFYARNVDDFKANELNILKNFKEYIEDEEDNMYGAYEGSMLVGLIWSPYFDDSETNLSKTPVLISDILIDNSFRRKGIGKLLVNHVVSKHKGRYIVADPIDERARRFFHSTGFRKDMLFDVDSEYMVVKLSK